MRRLALLLAIAVVVAPGAVAVGHERPDLKPVVLLARPGRVKVGTEKQTCHRLKWPRNEATQIGRVQIRVKGGSHHVHLYRPVPGVVDYPPKDCPFAVDFSKWELVAATQNETLDWQLPPGVAIDFTPHQPLMIQTHFVNTQALSVKGAAKAKMTLHPMDPSTVTAHAGALFGQDKTVLVPPGPHTQYSRCAMTGEGEHAREMTILALTGHYHFRGVRFQIFRVLADGSRGELLYDHAGYADPEFEQYPADNPLVLRAGEGLEWWCDWQNDTDTTFKFGPNTAMNEHCNMFAFYYPTETPNEAMACIHTTNAAGQDVNIRCGRDGVDCPSSPPPTPTP